MESVCYSASWIFNGRGNGKGMLIFHHMASSVWFSYNLSHNLPSQNLVKEFITDEFKTAVQAVLDQALHGEETANFEESVQLLV